MTTLTVRASGSLSLVEDLGRPGLAEVGVGRSGAADRGSLRLGNRVVGNPEGAAGVEVTAGGLEVEVGAQDVTFCVTGAVCEVTVDGRPVGSHALARAGAGGRIRLGPPRDGLRSYLTVRGGIDVAPVLGSRSHDVLAGLGPAPLVPGAVLPVGVPHGQVATLPYVPWPDHGGEVVLRVVRGPRAERVGDPDRLVRTRWQASERTNRVGMRLAGGSLDPVGDAELPSEGVWRGAVQVPPSGEPVVFLADHPVTGGYPVVAVVVDADVDRAAQVPPGRPVSFRWVDPP